MEFLRAGFKIASTAVYSLNKVSVFPLPSKLAEGSLMLAGLILGVCTGRARVALGMGMMLSSTTQSSTRNYIKKFAEQELGAEEAVVRPPLPCPYSRRQMPFKLLTRAGVRGYVSGGGRDEVCVAQDVQASKGQEQGHPGGHVALPRAAEHRCWR